MYSKKRENEIGVPKMTKIDQIAQAFAQGVKFAENLKLAMDAAKGKDDEDGHWVTVGEGEEARPVFIKGAKKKTAKAESKKKNDQIFHSMSRKEFIDTFKSTGGDVDELSENNTLKIWYKDHTFKHFDYESDPKELARAVRRPGIKAIVWSNEGDVEYYGSPKDIVLRNVNTDETKPLSEVQKDAGVGSLWVVDDVIDNSGDKKTESKPAQQRTERTTSQSQPRALRSTSGKAETVRELKDAYNVSADLIDEMTPKQADRPFLSRLDRIHKDAVALAESAPEITNSHELREMTRIMKNADKLVKALPRYYDRNYYGGWVQKIMGMVRGAEEAYTKLKERKTRGPNAAI